MDHAYNITIKSRAKIGKNVTMYKGATIGCDTEGAPVIGDLAIYWFECSDRRESDNWR